MAGGAGAESLFGTVDEPAAAAGPYAEVAVQKPLRCEFTYRVPAEFVEQLTPGMRVAVPFGRKREVGVVVGLSETTDLPASKTKAIAAVLDDEPVVDAELLELTRWMAGYYACSWGEALGAVLPAALKREKGTRKRLVIAPVDGVGQAELDLVEDAYPKQHRLLRTLIEIGEATELRDLLRKLNLSDSAAKTLAKRGWATIERVEVAADALLAGETTERVKPEQLSSQQADAVVAIARVLDDGEYRTFLLQGVTGSGKTEVYLRVIEHALASGRGAIVLVPEIALTPQTVGWFRSRFGEVAVLHSRMTDAQRYAMWQRLRRGDAKVVVGARSAIFAPVQNLGVIVVDEEHEPSFKQGNAPRYHARDVAVVRAHRSGAVCVLGSATPSLESWRNAKSGRYERLLLSERVHGGRMPAIEIIDMRDELPEKKGPKLFSRRLSIYLRQTLERGEQSILFLNRRGYSPVLWCPACGDTVRCKQCDMAMTFHRRHGKLICHSCCEELTPPKSCPSCTAPGVRFLGLGSERVEDSLAGELPGARIARMDSDTMLRREDYERTLDAFGKGEIDVLVGTQMIAKGLDFPRVTLVGIISADSGLHLPDFRASERTFQLLAQVAGRAGRGDLEGRIVIQTITPDHDAIKRAAEHDYEGFAALEDELRDDLGYPPHGRLIRAVLEDTDESKVLAASRALANLLIERVAPEGVMVLGPAPAPMALLRGRHRHHILLKAAPNCAGLAKARDLLIGFAEEFARPRTTIDIDPVSLL